MNITEWIGKSTYLLAIAGSGVFIAAVIVAVYVYEPKNDPENKEYEEEEDTNITPMFEEEEYDKKYTDELKKLDQQVLSETELEALKNKVLDEDTPLRCNKNVL